MRQELCKTTSNSSAGKQFPVVGREQREKWELGVSRAQQNGPAFGAGRHQLGKDTGFSRPGADA